MKDNKKSIFYSNENEVELLKKLGMYNQCFDYNGLFEFWCDWGMQEDIRNVIILPFHIYLCDKKYLYILKAIMKFNKDFDLLEFLLQVLVVIFLLYIFSSPIVGMLNSIIYNFQELSIFK